MIVSLKLTAIIEVVFWEGLNLGGIEKEREEG